MSEYQHYEFHAIDRPLNSKEMASVREMSSRVQLSARKAIFTYSYSDFRYSEEEVLLDYFDFMLYITNWGTKRIMMKFPLDVVDYDFLKKYRISVITDYEQDIRVKKRGKFVILDIDLTEEEGLGWIDEDEYGNDLLNIRAEIMEEDYRSLFMIWLRFLEDVFKSDDLDDDYSFESELIPLNLQGLSSSAKAAKEFYEVNEDWLAAIQLYADEGKEQSIDYEERVLKMPKDRMIAYMQMILKDEANLKIRLIKELKGENKKDKGKISGLNLLEVGEKVADIEQARLEAEQKKQAHEKSERMHMTRKNKNKIETQIIINIEQGNYKGYNLALSKIIDLKAMHDYFNTESNFQEFLNQLASEYSRKSSFIRMLKEKNLIE